MAVPFLNSITLNKNEIQEFKVFNIGTGDPTLASGGDKGYFWTDTATSVLKWWDGTNIRTLLDSASTISVADNLSGGVAGSLPYQTAVNDTVFLGIGTADQVLKVNTGATAPEWVNQSSLSVGSATNKPGGTLGDILVQSGSGTTTFLNVGTAGQVLTSNGASPAYVNQSTLSVGSATTATTATTANHISGGAAGELLYQSGLATTAKLAAGTNGYILTYDGSGGNAKPQWSASIPAGSVSGLAASATTDTTNAANITSGLLPLARLALATGQFYVGDASNNPAATAKSSISLTGFGALTEDLDIAGFNIINSGNVTSGSSGSTLATKGYVDSVAQGLDIKASCLVASTADINLSAPGSGLIDGIDPATFTSGTTRILVKDQSLSQQNGIYIWNGTGSAMTRSLDANTWDELVGAFTFIETGTANADSGWVCTANAGGTLGTTPVPFVKFSQAGSYTAGNGMVLSGGVFHFAQDTNYTAGRIPFASSTSAIGFNANLFWDNSNNRLGIGTASPDTQLHVKGTGSQTISVERDGATIAGRLDIISGNSTNLLRATTAKPLVFEQGTGVPSMTLDANGRLGLGVTPKTWNSSILAFQIGSYSSIADFLGYSQFANNFYNDGSDKFINAAAATRYFQVAGTHNWQRSTNASPTAGGAATMETSMTLDAAGNLGVGVTTVGERIHASGNIKAAGSAGTFPRFISEVGAKSWATGYRSGTTSFEIWEDSTTRLAIVNGGQVQVGINGTASVPAIANADNSDTGLYWPTDADTLALATGGSDRIYIAATGVIGVATTPSGWTGGAIINLANSGAISSKGTTTSVVSNGYFSDQWRHYGNGRYCQYYQNNGTHVFYGSDNNTNGADQPFTPLQYATIDASGNLGLGVTPAYRFHVYSLVNNETRFQTASTTAGHTNRLSFSVPTGTADTRSGAIEWYDLNTFKGDIRFLKAGGLQIRNSADSPTVTLDDSGNLSNVGYHKAGLFTVSAGGLSAFDAASGGLYNYYSSGGVIAAYSDNSGTLASLTLDASSFVFRTAGTTKLTLNNSGVLLLKTNGTASAPTIANADNPDTGLYWPTDVDTLALAVGGSDAVYIDANRRVGIGISSSIAATLHVEGAAAQARFSTAAASDARHEYYRNGVREAYINWDLDTFQIYGTKSGGSLLLGTNSTERLRIKSTGQLNFSGLASAPTGAVGDLYYNSTSNTLQYHNNSAFQQISRKYSTALAGTNTSFTVTHNFGTRDVTVQVRKSGSTYDLVYTDVQMTTENAVTVIFASSVTGSDYTVTVIG
jgi:hypothetical protein